MLAHEEAAREKDCAGALPTQIIGCINVIAGFLGHSSPLASKCLPTYRLLRTGYQELIIVVDFRHQQRIDEVNHEIHPWRIVQDKVETLQHEPICFKQHRRPRKGYSVCITSSSQRRKMLRIVPLLH